MYHFTNAKFIFENEWRTKGYEKEMLDTKNRLTLKLSFVKSDKENIDKRFVKPLNAKIDLLYFNPADYDLITNYYLKDQNLEVKLNNLFNLIRLPDNYVMFRQNKSIRLSPKFSKTVRRHLIHSAKVCYETTYYNENYYIFKNKSGSLITLSSFFDRLNKSLEKYYYLIDDINKDLELNYHS